MIVKTIIHNGDDPDTMTILTDQILVKDLRRFKDVMKRKLQATMIHPRITYITFFEEIDNDEV